MQIQVLIRQQDIEADKKRRKIAAVAALFFFALLILCLFLFKLREFDPPRFEKPPVEITVEMELPNLSGGSAGGSSSPIITEATPQPQPDPTPPNVVRPTPATQVTTQPQPSLSTPTSPNNTTTTETATPTTNPNAVFKPGGGGNTGSGGGTGDGQGTQSGTGTGTGSGPGVGSYELAGRNLMKRPAIDAKTQEVGVVAINIYVDQEGNVVNAVYNRAKSDIQNDALVQQCVKAAKTMKFNAEPGASIEQKGVYYFQFVKN